MAQRSDECHSRAERMGAIQHKCDYRGLAHHLERLNQEDYESQVGHVSSDTPAKARDGKGRIQYSHSDVLRYILRSLRQASLSIPLSLGILHDDWNTK
jgi:hypothetical protein